MHPVHLTVRVSAKKPKSCVTTPREKQPTPASPSRNSRGRSPRYLRARRTHIERKQPCYKPRGLNLSSFFLRFLFLCSVFFVLFGVVSSSPYVCFTLSAPGRPRRARGCPYPGIVGLLRARRLRGGPAAAAAPARRRRERLGCVGDFSGRLRRRRWLVRGEHTRRSPKGIDPSIYPSVWLSFARFAVSFFCYFWVFLWAKQRGR